MAAYAALVSLRNNIQTIMNHPILSTSLDNRHIQPLIEKTGLLLDFIEGNNYGGGSKEAQDIERQIASAVHAAEDMIESHVVDQIHAGAGEEGIACSLDLQQCIEDMDAIMENAIEEKREFEKEKSTHLTVARPLRENGESAMVGLDAELNQLLDELTRHQSSRRIISIVGMGGTGKTTLAYNVYQNLLIKERFQFRAWATVSQHNNAHEVLSKLLSDLGLAELSGETVVDLGLGLHKILFGRRYLIVLDDIWSVQVWDEVKHFFHDSGDGSRILLTTRLSNVAKDCGSSLFQINLLDEENSWKLFCKKTFHSEVCPPELRVVGQEIVKLCNGLALSIVVVGGLLQKSSPTVGYWKKVAENLKSIPNSKEKEESLDVLSLSYSHLPPHLKPCFLHIGVFKEDLQINISHLIKLWVAEGFIKPIRSKDLEEIAEGYIKDLIDRNLILVGRRRKNGKVGYCRIHYLLRELCLKLAKQEEFFHMSDDGIRGTHRRQVDNWCPEWTGVKHQVVRSIMTERCIKQPSEFRLLRVLDEGGHNSQVDYYGNVNLRYLAYNHNGDVKILWKLPTSISLIWNLQTLIIRRCESLIVAPIEFWKMRLLRHVECGKIYVPVPPPSNRQDELLILENLRTFKTLLNLRLCEEVCTMIPNIKKLHLHYEHHVHGYDDSLIEGVYNLDLLHKLESLNLSINCSAWLYLDRELRKKLITYLPRSLKKLSLSLCELYWDDMPIIGSLPLLEVLNLEVLSFSEGKRWNLVDGQFLRLKFLKISNCILICWDAHSSHFPVLEKLYLTSLHLLEEIPLAIGDIPTLEVIHVNWCSESAAISAVRIMEDQQDNDGQLQVEVRMRRKHLESFNQMLETEGLTTDNIQLRISG